MHPNPTQALYAGSSIPKALGPYRGCKPDLPLGAASLQPQVVSGSSGLPDLLHPLVLVSQLEDRRKGIMGQGVGGARRRQSGMVGGVRAGS